MQLSYFSYRSQFKLSFHHHCRDIIIVEIVPFARSPMGLQYPKATQFLENREPVLCHIFRDRIAANFLIYKQIFILPQAHIFIVNNHFTICPSLEDTVSSTSPEFKTNRRREPALPGRSSRIQKVVA